MHADQVGSHGGSFGLRDEGLLASAIERPRHRWAYETPDMTELAAAYAFGIARNHPFVDGNKRAAFMAAYTFLGLNGMELTASELSAVITFLALAAGELEEVEFADWFREHVEPV
jgi:death-on-curing protein